MSDTRAWCEATTTEASGPAAADTRAEHAVTKLIVRTSIPAPLARRADPQGVRREVDLLQEEGEPRDQRQHREEEEGADRPTQLRAEERVDEQPGDHEADQQPCRGAGVDGPAREVRTPPQHREVATPVPGFRLVESLPSLFQLASPIDHARETAGHDPE